MVLLLKSSWDILHSSCSPRFADLFYLVLIVIFLYFAYAIRNNEVSLLRHEEAIPRILSKLQWPINQVLWNGDTKIGEELKDILPEAKGH